MKLSIIVPIYGVEKYLRQCLDSISKQTFSDFECILIDDGSKDGCPAICDEYADKDIRFKVVHKKNAGYGVAVNTGLDLVKGEWVGIVEPDDWIEPDMYELLLAHAEDGIDVVKAEFSSFSDRDGQEGYSICFDDALKGRRKLSEISQLLKFHPSIWTCIYRKIFLSSSGIRMEESAGATWQDNLFQVQTLVMAKFISCVPKRVYHYRTFDKPLKDAMLPMRRTLQIRQWLLSVGYLDYNSCSALFAREMYYVWMSIAVVKFKELLQLVAAISELLNIYRVGFSHRYDFKGILSLLHRSPLIYVLYIKLRCVLKIGRLLKILHLK